MGKGGCLKSETGFFWYQEVNLSVPCNGLPEGYDSIETTAENHDAILAAVRELEQQRHEMESRCRYEEMFS